MLCVSPVLARVWYAGCRLRRAALLEDLNGWFRLTDATFCDIQIMHQDGASNLHASLAKRLQSCRHPGAAMETDQQQTAGFCPGCHKCRNTVLPPNATPEYSTPLLPSPCTSSPRRSCLPLGVAVASSASISRSFLVTAACCVCAAAVAGISRAISCCLLCRATPAAPTCCALLRCANFACRLLGRLRAHVSHTRAAHKV
jgi:hypothetical protein